VVTSCAMKTAVLLVSLLMLSGCYSYNALVPEHDVPAGTVLQDSDFRNEWCGSIGESMGDLAVDRSRVVGHKALNPLHGGTRFHYSDIAQ